MIPTSDLSHLVADIKAGKCALVLGPEIFSVQNSCSRATSKANSWTASATK